MSKTCLVLGAGALQIKVIEEAKKMGYETIVADQNENAPGARLADTFLAVSTREPSALIERLTSLRKSPAIILTVATDMTQTMATLNEHYSLRGINERQAYLITDKSAMREFLTAHGFLQPRFIESKSKDDIYQFMKENPRGAGFVIKPVENMGARGVLYLPDETHVSYAFEMAQKQSMSARVIIEEFIEAHEISTDALVYEGEVFLTGIADRMIVRSENRYFIEHGHTLPSKIAAQTKEKVIAELQRLSDALEQEGRPFHGALKGDIRITPAGDIIFGEIASRLSGGFMSTHTYPLATGNNLMKGYIELLSGTMPGFIKNKQHDKYDRVAIERCIIAEPGQLASVSHDLGTELSGIEHVHLNYEEGDFIFPLQSNIGKFAHIVTSDKTLESAESRFEALKSKLEYTTRWPEMKEKEILKVSRKHFNHEACWVCKVCDAEHCASSVPGMGGTGRMNTFKDNIRALHEIKIAAKYLEEDKNRSVAKPNVSINLFGLQSAAPVLSAPITGSITNMAGSTTEWDYAIETGSALKQLGLIPTFGDGATVDKYLVGLHAIKQLETGLPVFKPRADEDEMIRRIVAAKEFGAKAWGIDIDGVSFKTMTMRSQQTERKSVSGIRRLADAVDIPFFLKGVMSIEDAKKACDSGAAAIIVSNHGGRVLDDVPGTARVLGEIAEFVKKQYPHVRILADGGIRSGYDIFKMLALGAEAVLVGRPITIAMMAQKRFSVAALLTQYIDDLKRIMSVLAIESIDKIRKEHILI